MSDKGHDKSDSWGIFGDHKPPDEPQKVIYHGPYRDSKNIPEEYRRIFGSPPPKGYKKPVPPPPLPPNSYHKKPKYWQMRYTSHQQIPNRVAGVTCLAICGVVYLIHKLSNAPSRWQDRFGMGMTPQKKLDYDQKNKFYADLMFSMTPYTSFATDLSGEKYINVRRADNKVRWDLREVDHNIVGTRDMANPMDNPL